MKRHRNEKGSTLLLVLGIVAALAICATTLVALTGNVMSNTATNRVNITAFNACESAINTTMLQLGVSWPNTYATRYIAWGDRTPSPIESFRSAMTTQGVEWPSPTPTTLGPAINVRVYDDPEVTPAGGWPSPYSATNPPPWDANANASSPDRAFLYIVAQACVGDRRARIQVKVERTAGGLPLQRGTDLWCGGDLHDTGAEWLDDNLKATDVQPPLDKTATSGPNAVRAYIAGTLYLSPGETLLNKGGLTDNPPVVTTPSSMEDGVSTWKALDEVFATELVQRAVSKAKAEGTYYTTATPPAGMSGFLVIDLWNYDTQQPPAPGTTVSLSSGPGNINSVVAPGVIVVLGSPPPYGPSPNVTVTMTGSGGTYYGVVYTTGNFTSNVAGDSPHIRGAVYVQGNVNFAGKDHFYYEDRCIIPLGLALSHNCTQVPGTWRETKPQ